MTSVVWGAIAFSLGLLLYLGLPVAVANRAAPVRNSIAQVYWGLAARSFGRVALVRRKVGGYELHTVETDEAKGAGKVTLESPMLGSDSVLHFGDPDNRMHRWKQKPMVLLHESVPGAVDLELAEVGHSWREHVRDGRHLIEDAVNPFFEVAASNRLASLDDVIPLVTHGSEPRDPGTMEDWTKKAFEKYRDNVGATELLITFMGFGIGLGGVILLVYVQTKLLDGATDPGVSVPINMLSDSLVLLL